VQQARATITASIASRREVAEGTLEATFDLGGRSLEYEPGQYVVVELIDAPYQDKRRNRRHFSILNPPSREGVVMIATRLRDTGFKRSLAEMEPGAQARIGPVNGTFTLPRDTSRPIVFIAGGIGITPFYCMLNHVHDKALQHTITLLYANPRREITAYFDDLRKLADDMANFRLVMTMDHDPDWPGETRMINADFVRDYIDDPRACLFMVAGPPGIDTAMRSALAELGVADENIITERFTGY